MYVATTRWLATNGWAEANKGYDKLKPVWSAQPGFHSMSLYDVVGDHNNGQRMTVLRFKDQASFEAAREKMKGEIDELTSSLERGGVKAVERMRLEELS